MSFSRAWFLEAKDCLFFFFIVSADVIFIFSLLLFVFLVQRAVGDILSDLVIDILCPSRAAWFLEAKDCFFTFFHCLGWSDFNLYRFLLTVFVGCTYFLMEQICADSSWRTGGREKFWWDERIGHISFDFILETWSEFRLCF